MSFEALFILGAAAFVTGLLATIYFYVSFRRASSPEAGSSLVRYFALATLFGLAAYLAGTAIGIYAGCASPTSGNLCGIWGALGVGPLLSGIALWVYGPIWRKRMLK